LEQSQTLLHSMIDQGLQALKKSKFQDAEACFAQAISLDEQNITGWTNLGLTWLKMGKFSEAVDAYTMANHLSPETADILYNLGLAYIQNKQDQAGLTHLEHSHKLHPDFDLAILLGDSFNNLSDYGKSAYYYLSAFKTNKTNESLNNKLAIALYRNGDLDQAIAISIQLVNSHPKEQKYMDMLADFYRRVPNTHYNPHAHAAIEICLKQDNIKFSNLRPVWSSLFLLDPKLQKLRDFARQTDHSGANSICLEDIAKDLGSFFICAGLTKISASGIPLEFMFSNIRKYLLLDWKNCENWPKEVFPFLVALSILCWFNDFVYYVSLEEKDSLEDLRETLAKSLDAPDKKLPDNIAKMLTLYCCYEPLYTLYNKGKNLPFSKTALYHMRPLILHQLTNPKEEARLFSQIPSFTEIEDVTSLAVQKMYEQRPYPRWSSSAVSAPQADLKQASLGLEILVAGCGTGQETAFYANTAQGAQITAVDLSRTSIAYGMRQAKEMGFLPRINFLHGDLMQVGKLEKTFDYITSSGVLHHLKDPEKGLAAIVSTLKPNGRMSLSLYSKVARKYALDPASEYISQKGYSSSVDDIRQFRRDLFFMQADDPILRCTTAADFFNLAECNDMLFHVQEHRHTLLEFKEMAARHGLEPFDIYLSPEKRKAFHALFPDKDPLDFEALTAYEEKYPKSFIEMYKIYFKRIGDTSTHPLDRLIHLGAI
jgi:2-polyprenyl-3-methyl-5-hydroxy-6-metoxy-1,4-benzoquinol methylase/Flp pilus assembly protein TadD